MQIESVLNLSCEEVNLFAILEVCITDNGEKAKVLACTTCRDKMRAVRNQAAVMAYMNLTSLKSAEFDFTADQIRKGLNLRPEVEITTNLLLTFFAKVHYMKFEF